MKLMTEEEALSKCKFYDGKNIPADKNTLGNYEKAFVSMAQKADGVRVLNGMVRAFEASPASKAISAVGNAFEPIVALLWSRWKYWDGGPYEADEAKWEADLGESFTKMIAEDYN